MTKIPLTGILVGQNPSNIACERKTKFKPQLRDCFLRAVFLMLALTAIPARSATVFKEAGGLIVIEAEHFNARTANPDGGHWAVIPTETLPPAGTPDMANARDGAYVRSLPDSAGGGVNHNVAGDALSTPPFIDYSVVINTVGDYKFFMRWGGYDGSSDSIYAQIVELNAQEPMWYRFAKAIPTNFDDPTAGWDGGGAVDDITAGGAEIPAVWTISAPGTYTVRITQREDGSSLDTILLQLASKPDPGTPGPAESDLQTGFIISSQPANKLALPPNTATFNFVAKVGATGGPITYQWQSKAPGATTFSNIPAATAVSYTTPATTEAMSGTQYRVLATSDGTVLTSFAASLITDSTPPKLVHSYSGPASSTVTMTFSEPLAPNSVTNTANYTVSGGITVSSAVIGSDKKSVFLKTSPLTAGTSYTVTVAGITDLAGNAVTSATSSFKGPVLAPNSLLARKFEGITGTAVSDLLTNSKYPNAPTSVEFWTDFGITRFPGTGDNLGENYGLEVTGLIVPATTADYEFYIASDDASRLELSTDESPANAKTISFQNGCCNAFTHNPGILSSQPIHLESGKQYYVHAYLKEGGGGDFLYVAWRNSVDDGDTTVPPESGSVIPGSVLVAGYDPSVTISIDNQPVSVSTAANTPASFTVGYTAYSPVYGTTALIQWQNSAPGSSTFNDIVGANAATYSIPLVAPADSGFKYRAILTVNDVSATSNVPTLTVTSDSVAPTVTAFSGNLTSATITFSEPIDPVTGAAATSYSISPGGAIGTITVSTTAAGYGQAKLDLSGLAPGTTYTISIKNVKDVALNAMTQVTKTFTAYSYFADFNDGTVPAGATAVGFANVKPSGSAGSFDGSGFLELTAPAGSLNGTFGIDDVLNGADATNVTVKLKMFVGNGSGNPADGFSVNIAGDIDPTSLNTSEEGSGSGLTIAFDTYDNGGGEAPAIDVKWGGTVVASALVSKASLVNNQWVDIFIELTGDPNTGVGKVTVIHNNVIIHDALEIADFTAITGPKIAIGARTGGEFERALVDNITVLYNAPVPIPQPPTISITAPTDGSAIAAGATANITVNVVASAGVQKVEFFANGSKLGESNVTPYTFTVPTVPAGIYSVSAKVTDNNGQVVTSNPVTVTARPAAGAQKVLFVRATGGANTSDLAVMNYLFSRGMDVYDTPALASAATDADGKALVMISSSVGSGDVNVKFRDVAAGVVNWENALLDDFLLTLNDGTVDHSTIVTQTAIDLTPAGAAHPIGAGLSAGSITVVTAPTDLSWGKPTSSAVVIASIAGDATKSAIFAVEKGGLLIDGTSTAAGRRVHFMMADLTFPLLTPDGRKLFDAATDWARGAGAVAPQPKITATRTGNQLTLTWTNGGTLQQAPTVIGAWTDVSATGTFTTTIPTGAGAAFFRVIRIP